VNVDTGAFEALTAQVAKLTEAVQAEVLKSITLDAIFDAGFAAGQDDIRKSMGQPSRGRARATRRAAGSGHLRAVQGGGGRECSN
jgi:hypothetical protein